MERMAESQLAEPRVAIQPSMWRYSILATSPGLGQRTAAPMRDGDRIILCMTVGYFIWDLFVCIWFKWGAFFLTHAVASPVSYTHLTLPTICSV